MLHSQDAVGNVTQQLLNQMLPCMSLYRRFLNKCSLLYVLCLFLTHFEPGFSSNNSCLGNAFIVILLNRRKKKSFNGLHHFDTFQSKSIRRLTTNQTQVRWSLHFCTYFQIISQSDNFFKLHFKVDMYAVCSFWIVFLSHNYSNNHLCMIHHGR